MYPLKQSTAVIRKMGPFVDEDNGKTVETGLTITQSDIQISKNGAAFAQTSDFNPVTTHDVDGWYPIAFTTTDTGTLGSFTVKVHMAGALSVWKDFMVVPANTYNALVLGSVPLEVDAVEWLGTAPLVLSNQRVQVDVQAIEGLPSAATVLGLWLAEGRAPIADSGTTTTLVDVMLTQADDYWNGALLVFRSGTNSGRTAIITDFDAGTDTLTFAPAMPDAVTTEGYILVPGLGWTDSGEAIRNSIGTPVALDGGAATIGGMLTKMADDSGGSSFDAGTDSLNKLQGAVTAGFPQHINADDEPSGGIITTGSNAANDSDSTWADDGAYWQVAATDAVGGFGLNMHQFFTLGTTIKASILHVNAKETLAGVVHVWLWDYVAAAWEQVSDTDSAITGNADKDYTYIFNPRHQQASDGEVKVRYSSTDTASNKYLYLDEVYIAAVAVSELTAAEIAQAVWETDLADIHGAFSESAGHRLHDIFALVTTIATGDTATSFTLTDGVAVNDAYNGMVIIIEDATDSHYEARRIIDYTSGRVVTVDRAFGFTPASDDHAEIANLSYADVNVTHLAASVIQQSGGYVKVSAGTGTGQIALASGKVDVSHLAGSTIQQVDGYVKISNGTGTGQVSLSSGKVTLASGSLDSVADSVWDESLSGHAGAGTAGLALSTAAGISPSAATVADAVWDELLSGHTGAGTAGAALSTVTATGDITINDNNYTISNW